MWRGPLMRSQVLAPPRHSLPPDPSLGPSKLFELSCAQRGFGGREELVELRRPDPRIAEHGMRLATVMDLVLEEVQQEAVSPLALHPRAAMHVDDSFGAVLIQGSAPGDQPAVNRSLR